VTAKRTYAAAVVECSPDEFEQLVADALDAIPPELGERMDNVVVLVEDEPTPEQLEGNPDGLLGLYEGVDLTERSPFDYAGVLPDRITIFRLPHLAEATSWDDLVDLVHETVIHEVAHHFGIDDGRLEELGWD
jgi:predicted Zn-dependent protease with MMP-like domain